MTEAVLPEDLLARLRTRYAEPQRHYHTLAHIEALRGWLGRYRTLALRPDDIETSIWFHDVVYDRTTRPGRQRWPTSS